MFRPFKVLREQMRDYYDRADRRTSQEVQWLRHEIKELRDALNDVYKYDLSGRFLVDTPNSGSVLRFRMSKSVALPIRNDAEKQPG